MNIILVFSYAGVQATKFQPITRGKSGEPNRKKIVVTQTAGRAQDL
jgi:hypothetical protein